MKKDIHPKYDSIDVICSCGNKFSVNSTASKPLTLDICGKCHPFYTGKQKLVDTAGRVEKFKQKYAKKTAAKKVNEE